MPIRIDCPRCKKPLAVPSKKAGSYASCPSCNGRFWVPADAPQEPSPPAIPTPPAAPPTTAPGSPLEKGATAGEVATPPFPTPPAGQAPAGPPQAAPPSAKPGRKVARFITAEAAQSTLTLAEDGQLPELHLDEGEEAKQRQTGGASMNPLVMLGLLAMSMVLSLTLALVDLEPEGPSNASQRDTARYMIERDYFADEEHLKLENPPPLKPCQVLLRDAQRAHSRGDYKTERDRYRRVLALLRSERGKFEGITGSPARDRTLEEQLIILLSK